MARSDKTRAGRQSLLLGALAVGMFGFAFALVPLYEIFCELTGINGRTGGQAEVVATEADGRTVTIRFVGKVARGLAWEFRPTVASVDVRVGEINTTEFYARNAAPRTVVGQAVPSVAPSHAAPHLKKIECFCFNRQPLEAGEETDMPVRYVVSAELPADVHTLTLSYTMFPLDEEQLASAVNEPEQRP